MYQTLFEKLQPYHQTHILQFWDSLTPEEQTHLGAQINELDLSHLMTLSKQYVLQKPPAPTFDHLEPAPFFPITPSNECEKTHYAQATELGEQLLSEGKVAFLTVAGGQGSRLGFDGPKGTYLITPVAHKSFFQYFAETIGRLNEKYQTTFTWYIMTSQINDQATQNFFQSHNFFGLKPQSVVFFSQGTMPAISYEGKLLLEKKHSLALAPDGHGGTLLALRRKGCLERMQREGTEYLSYFQVDNPIVTIADPLFVGLHAMEKSEISARMLPKTGPYEKLGNFCMVHNRLTIIEYSDMPNELAEKRNANGALTFLAGSPAIHMISRAFIEQLTQNERLNLPWHRADKKVAFINENGEWIKPEDNNAVKLESFIFDAIPLAQKTMILEAIREDQFAPTKNPTGVDSVESCRQMLSDRDTRWLKAANVEVPDGALVELSMRACVDAQDVVEFVKKPTFVAPTLDGNNYYQ